MYYSWLCLELVCNGPKTLEEKISFLTVACNMQQASVISPGREGHCPTATCRPVIH